LTDIDRPKLSYSEIEQATGWRYLHNKPRQFQNPHTGEIYSRRAALDKATSKLTHGEVTKYAEWYPEKVYKHLDKSGRLYIEITGVRKLETMWKKAEVYFRKYSRAPIAIRLEGFPIIGYKVLEKTEKNSIIFVQAAYRRTGEAWLQRSAGVLAPISNLLDDIIAMILVVYLKETLQ
jgi:hypothetical protein